MRVLVVGTGGGIVSGISTAADQMVRRLQEQGIDVERLVVGDARRRSPNRTNAENVRAALRDAANSFRKARTFDADVLWIHTFGVPILPVVKALALVIAGRLAGARPVVHLHAFGLEDALDEGGWVLAKALRLLDALSSLVVVLYGGAAEAIRLRTGARSVAVLENAVPVPAKSAPWPDSDPFVVLFVGGLVERKGLPALVQAMDLLTDLDVQLRLVGGAGEDGGETVVALRPVLKRLHELHRLVQLGELPQDEVRDQLRRGHVLVLPSSAEGMPMAVLEAMAEGRPVIVSCAGNMGQVVSEAGAGLVLDSVSSDSIASAVRSLAGDPIRAREIGRAGREHVRALERQSTEKLLRLLRRVASGSNVVVREARS